jgi:hypothetical protein
LLLPGPEILDISMAGETVELGPQLTRPCPVVLQVTVSLRFDVSKAVGVFSNISKMDDTMAVQL